MTRVPPAPPAAPQSRVRRIPLARHQPGVPTAIIAAETRYAMWCEKLAQRGYSPDEADAFILEVAELEGGVALADETINLALWSRRTGIPRAVLEALVLAAHRKLPVASPSPLPEQTAHADVDAADEPWTPAPVGVRSPSLPPPSSQHYV